MQKTINRVVVSSSLVAFVMIMFMQMVNVLSLVERKEVVANVASNILEKTSVDNSADGVEFSKSVELTTYHGKERDEAGNPYVKIQLKLDATSANDKVLNYTENTRSTDVVLMLDTSSSMKGKKFKSEKEAAMNFVSQLMEQGDNIRLCVIRFDTKVEVLGSFNDSKQDIHESITEISEKDLGSLTDLQGAIIAGQRELRRSNATNKVMILLTDGEPNVFYSGDEPDEMASNDAYVGTETQYGYAKKLVPDAIWYTIGYDLDSDKANALLEDMATENEYGEKYFYSANAKEGNKKDNLQEVFDKIASLISKEIESNKLVDILPEPLVLLEDTFESNDSRIIVQRDNNDKMITYSWGDGDIVDKLYKFSFIAKVDLSKLSEAQITGKEPINTNGLSVDIISNSEGSAYFSYAGDNTISLKSPSIYIPQEEEESPEPTPTPEPTLPPNPEDLITVQKYAQWTKFNGNEYDGAGNPYTLISFDIDMRDVTLEEDSYMTVTDYIPEEYTLLTNTISVGTGVTYTLENDGHIIKFIWNSDIIDNKKYRVSFITLLDKSAISEDMIVNGKANIYTNGSTIKGDNKAGALYQYGDYFITEIQSPSLKLDLRERYKVILHTNGGWFKNGIIEYEYISGEGLMLPGPNDVIRDDGFELVAWKDNPMLLGESIIMISTEMTGDIELWAQWDKGPGFAEPIIYVEKYVEWTGEYDDVGNPYTNFTFSIDMTDPSLFYFKSNYVGDTMDVIFMLDLSESFSDTKFNKMINGVKESVDILSKVCAKDVRIGIVGVSSSQQQLLGFYDTSRCEELMDRLDLLQKSGKTDLIKGFDMAAELFKKDYEGANHRTIVLMTDGYDEDETSDITSIYKDINSAYANLKQDFYDVRLMSMPYDADEQTSSRLGIMSSYNDRGLWMYLNVTDDETKLEQEKEINKEIVSLFNNQYDYYSVGEAYRQVVHMVIEKIGTGICLTDLIPKEYTIDKGSIEVPRGVYYEFDELDKKVEFRISSKDLAALQYEISFDAVLDLNKIPEECISEGNATIYTNGITVKEKMNEGALFRYGADFFAVLESPSLECFVDNKFSITLHPNGGIIDEAAKVTEYVGGIGINLPGSASVYRENYTFAGWYDNADCIGTRYYYVSAQDRGDKAYWAKWIKNQYSVYLNTNGGTIAAGKNVTSYYEGEGAILPKLDEVTRDNYTFLGWYNNSGFNGSPVTEITASETGNKWYYARWSADQYNVTLHTNGGTIKSGKEVTKYVYGRGATLPTATEITYDNEEMLVVFAGWYDNEELKGNVVYDISPEETGDKEFWAKWVDISSLKEKSVLYVYGLEGIIGKYTAEKVLLSIGTVSDIGVDDEKIRAWVGATQNPLSGRISDIFELKPGQVEEVILPEEIVNYVGGEKDDSKVYLHVEYGPIRIVTELTVRYCAAFNQH